MAYTSIAYIVMAYVVMAYTSIASMSIAYKVMAYISIIAPIGMRCVVITCIVLVLAESVMA